MNSMNWRSLIKQSLSVSGRFMISVSYRSDITNPSSLITLFTYLDEILPQESSSNNRKTFKISY